MTHGFVYDDFPFFNIELGHIKGTGADTGQAFDTVFHIHLGRDGR